MAPTIWVFGDQLNRAIGALADAIAGEDRVLLVESRAKLDDARHRQRTHLVAAAMRRFADELADAGFEVDLRPAATLADGLAAHRGTYRSAEVVATEPTSWDARRLLERLEVPTQCSNQFLCHQDDFASWADDRLRRRPVGWWPTSRRQAQARLRHAVDELLPLFGPHWPGWRSGRWWRG